MKQDHECRMRIEGILSEGIRNIVAMEDGSSFDGCLDSLEKVLNKKSLKLS